MTDSEVSDRTVKIIWRKVFELEVESHLTYSHFGIDVFSVYQHRVHCAFRVARARGKLRVTVHKLLS